MSARKILFIAYYFPPTGGAGVQRSLKFVKYLIDAGFELNIVTVTGDSFYYTDETLRSEVPESAKITQKKSYKFSNSFTFLNRLNLKFIYSIIQIIEYLLLIPDNEFFWYLFNRKQILKLAKEKNIEFVISSSTPYSSHLIAKYLKKKMHVKWIADFRDAYVKSPMKYVNAIIKIFTFAKLPFDKQIEYQILKNANAVVTASEGITNDFISDYRTKFDTTKFHTITNGYDEHDFANISPKEKDVAYFQIVYSGTFSMFQHPFHFLNAFLRFFKNLQESDKNKIKVAFTGKSRHKARTKAFIEKNGLSEVFQLSDYAPHQKVIENAEDADLTLLFVGKGKYTNVVYTGKIFELIRINTPIFAMVQLDSMAARLVKKTKTGYIAEFDDEQAIEQQLSWLFEKWKSKTLQPEYEEMKKYELIPQYERKNLTKKLVEIINVLT